MVAKDRRLRVLQVLPSIESASGGPIRSTLANCRAVHRVDEEIETRLLSTDAGLTKAWQEEIVGRLPQRMDLELFPLIGRHTFSFSPELLRSMLQKVDDWDLVVVRALLHPVSSAVAWATRRTDTPYIVVPHGTLSHYTFEYKRTFLKRLYYSLIDRQTVACADGIRFTSEVERQEAQRFDLPNRAQVIPHPYEPTPSDVEYSSRDEGHVLFLSRLSHKKGLSQLVSAFRIVLNERPSARLTIAGSGDEAVEGELRCDIRRRNLNEAVDCVGFVEGVEKRKLFNSASVFVLPSRYENFGIAVVEAMDAGMPVVVTKGVDTWPLIREHGAGIIVNHGDDQALASAIIRIIDNSTSAGDMGRAGRELVAKEFEPQHIGREVANLYREVVGAAKRRRGGAGH